MLNSRAPNLVLRFDIWNLSFPIKRYFNSRFIQHFRRKIVGIAVLENDLLHAGVNNHLGADAAGLVGAVKGGAVDVGAVLGGLDDGVLLGVQSSAYLMPFSGRDSELFAQAAAVKTVLNAGRRSVVARCQDVFILYENSADPAAQAGSALLDQVRDLHEIFVPGRAGHRLTPILKFEYGRPKQA
jgi:hypothetical protein